MMLKIFICTILVVASVAQYPPNPPTAMPTAMPISWPPVANPTGVCRSVLRVGRSYQFMGLIGTGCVPNMKKIFGLAFSPDEKIIYLTGIHTNVIRKYDVLMGTTTTLAGSTGNGGRTDGNGGSARFSNPAGITINPDGSLIWVTEMAGGRIRQIVTSTGQTTTLAGDTTQTNSGLISRDGFGTSARLYGPMQIAYSDSENVLYFVEMWGNKVRKLNLVTNYVETIAGPASGSMSSGYLDGSDTVARFNNPQGLALSSDGKIIYIGDTFNNRIRKLVIATREVTTIAGGDQAGYANDVGTLAILSGPRGLRLSPNDDTLYFVESFSYSLTYNRRRRTTEEHLVDEFPIVWSPTTEEDSLYSNITQDHRELSNKNKKDWRKDWDLKRVQDDDIWIDNNGDRKRKHKRHNYYKNNDDSNDDRIKDREDKDGDDRECKRTDPAPLRGHRVRSIDLTTYDVSLVAGSGNAGGEEKNVYWCLFLKIIQFFYSFYHYLFLL